MLLPSLTDWDNTRQGLHAAAQVIGAVRAATAEPQPNYTHLGLLVDPVGLTTGPLPGVGELVLQFGAQAILYKPPDREPAGFALAQHTQRSLADAVETGLSALGHPVALNRDKITGDALLTIDAAQAARYARALNAVADTMARFYETLPGEKTPLIVWPHGFDLSFLWFATATASEEAPHLAFGFSPYSAGLGRPYFYTYAYPVPDGLLDLKLPPLTRWQTEGWTGTVTAYDDLTSMPDFAVTIFHIFRAIYLGVSPLLAPSS